MKKYLLIAAVIIMSFFAYRYCISRLNPFYDAVTNISLSDFESKEQLMEFMNSHLPVKLPDSAEVEKLEYVIWQDFNLKATVVLPPEEAIVYAKKVDAIKVQEDYGGHGLYDEDIMYYNIQEPPVTGSIIADPNTGRIMIKCTNPNGK